MIQIHSPQPRFIAADLFCGGGGATRGLIDAGGYVAAGVDIETACQNTYESNNPNSTLDKTPPRFIAEDIASSSSLTALAGEITRARAMSPRAPLGLAICAPCQPFTRIQRNGKLTQQKRLAYKSDVSLLASTLPHIRMLMPDFIIAENVAQLTAPSHASTMNEFASALTELGYATIRETLCASNFGVAQIRRRAALIAVHAAAPPPIPKSARGAPAPTAKDAIGYLPPISAGETHRRIPNHRSAGLSDINKRRLRSLKPGASSAAWRNSPYGDIRPEYQKRRSWTDTFKNVGTRISADSPAPAITTKFFNMMCGRFGHYNQLRALSLREGACLQGFPRDYVFHGNSMESIARMIGNAAPPPLITALAQAALNVAKSAHHESPGNRRP